jgi:hypothetical protein
MMRFFTHRTRIGRTSQPQSFGTDRSRELFRRSRTHSTSTVERLSGLEFQLQKQARRLCTDCAKMHRFQKIRVTFEQKAGSPIYWKR